MTERGRDRRAGGGSSLLRRPLPVIASALASFLVVLTLLTARVVTGSDPALHPGTSSAVVVSRHGHTVLRTTASGKVISVGTQGAGAQGVGAQPAPVVTRTSGGFAGAGEQDG